MRNLAILLFDDVEILDFAGPFEVFAITRDLDDSETPLFNVYTVAEEPRPIVTRNGLSINPTYTLDECPKPHIFLVPGGQGTRTEVDNPAVIGWITGQAPDAELVLSVCTGALLLGKAGLLDGLDATTHHSAFEELAEVAPHTTLHRGRRYIDNGLLVTSAGISAGIDMSLYIIAKLHGKEQARQTAHDMEYNWQEND